MNKRLLADVLWEAANKRLSSSNSYDEKGTISATCCAAYWAELGHEWGTQRGSWEEVSEKSAAVSFLADLGCPVGSSAAFESFIDAKERQGVRYMWLLLAMHVAEDEGIEI